MKLKEVVVKNFRSIENISFLMADYSLLIGANNSGKTNIIDALRIFYEKDLKFNKSKDLPKFPTMESESWIELEYALNDNEFQSLKEEYQYEENSLRLRKYLHSDSEPNRIKTNQSNIYAYEKNGALSQNLFYGAKAVSEGKLGDVLYIPELSKVDEYAKLTGPSILRNTLEFVLNRVLKASASFGRLSEAFEDFNLSFKKEEAREGYSIKKLQEQINEEIDSWQTEFGLTINSIRTEDITRTLLKHYLIDKNLPEQEMDIGSFGQGLQRHLIYVLIKISSRYKEEKEQKERKEFKPDFTLILFEEPEAFLHPAQQEVLNLSLKEIAAAVSNQILISTHSSHFVSKNIADLPSMIRLKKEGPRTLTFLVDRESLDDLTAENRELKKILGEESDKKDLAYEAFFYSLWMDPDRCCSFFADRVLICEGSSEKLLTDQLIFEKKWSPALQRLYILQSAGKENLHRYMNLFGRLGIEHSVLFDGDPDSSRQATINEFIQRNENLFTRGRYQFPTDFEDFLGIEKETNPRKKPHNVLWHYKYGKISNEKMNDYIHVLDSLMK